MLNFYKSFADRLYSNEKLLEITKKEVAKAYGIPKTVLDEVKTTYMPLPWFVYIQKIGNKVKGFLGKILGMYKRAFNKKEIVIDYLLALKSRYSYEALKQYVKTLAEEFAHAAQDYLGKLKPKNFLDYLKNYRKDENEIEAKRVAEKVSKKVLDSLKLKKSNFTYKPSFNFLLALNKFIERLVSKMSYWGYEYATNF